MNTVIPKLSRMEIIKHHRQNQSIIELERKATKAMRIKGNMWVQEELDLATARANKLIIDFGWK